MLRCPGFEYLGVILNLFHPVEFSEIIHLIVLAHSPLLYKIVLAYTHIIRCLHNVFEDILYYTLSFNHTLSFLTS